MSDWSDAAVDYVQAIADTKLLLSHRYSQWMLSGPALEDSIAGASTAQDELGHVRQLFDLLEDQGREYEWLEGDREPEEYANASPLDEKPPDWIAFVATIGPVERASWYLLDAIDHDDFDGLVTRIGQEEFFHLEFLDGRLATFAREEPDTVRETLEGTLPGVLAYIGPPAYGRDTDPLLTDGFTDRPTTALRSSFREKYEEVLSETPVDPAEVAVDWDAPPLESWDETRRRVEAGSISEEDATYLSGVRNEEFVME